MSDYGLGFVVGFMASVFVYLIWLEITAFALKIKIINSLSERAEVVKQIMEKERLENKEDMLK